jgi:hypothetical protein
LQSSRMAKLARESSMEDEFSHGDDASGSGCSAERPIFACGTTVPNPGPGEVRIPRLVASATGTFAKTGSCDLPT